jgi:MFS family permease
LASTEVDTESSPARPPATFSSVFAVAEFRYLWVAQVLSVVGDQLARVAMTVLVYDQTRSAFWAAVTYAVTLVPWLLGGLALSGLADRLPRRAVMITCDLLRTVLVAAMALLSLGQTGDARLLLLVILLFAVTLLDSPFKAARSAMLPDILTGDRYVLGVAVSQTALQVGMVVGFALGGVVVAALHADGALALDAATFAGSAILLRAGVHGRPAAARQAAASGLREIGAGVRLVFAEPVLRTLMLFGWLVTFYIVPMGLAAPLARGLHSGLPQAVATGLVFAAGPFGTMLGAIAFSRLVPADRRQAWLGPLAIAACAVLVLFAVHLEIVACLLVLALSGACAAYQLAANAAFVAVVPPERRGQAFGLANGGMQVFQGLWIVLAGALAERTLTPSEVIAISGGIGAAAAAALVLSRRRQSAGPAAPEPATR